jgi:hypothetical protein
MVEEEGTGDGFRSDNFTVTISPNHPIVLVRPLPSPANRRTATKTVANRNVRLWHGRYRKRSLNDGQIPTFRGVRVALGTGYNRVEGIRRASRNGLVSSSPTRNE